MSNAGQTVLTVVGAVIGFYLGGPTGAIYGAQLGLLAGGALFPTQLPALQGPRLGDGQQTLSQVGAPIPWTHGTQTVGGNIIWAGPIHEVANTNTAGGKGSPEQAQTTYSYYRSFAILLCEGEIAGVRRIWANGKLIYDRSIPPGVDFDNPTQGQLNTLTGREALNTAWTSRMTIYTGTEDQLPDPVIESFEGVGNVPGYRGYAYVVFDEVQLQAEDGNRIPASWKFEVYEEGEGFTQGEYFYAQEVLYPWVTGTRLDPRNPKNKHNILVTSPISLSATQDPGDPDPIDAMLIACMEASGFDRRVLMGTAAAVNGTGTRLHIDAVGGTTEEDKQNAARVYMHYNKVEPDLFNQEGDLAPSCPGYPPGTFWYRDDANGSVLYWASGQINSDDPFVPGWGGRNAGCLTAGDTIIYESTRLEVRVDRIPVAPPPPREIGFQIADTSYYVVSGIAMPDKDWEYDDSQTYHVLQKFDAGYADPGIKHTTLPLGPALPVGHVNDTQEFWEAAYANAVAIGAMDQGLVYGDDYPQLQSYAYRIHNQIDVVEPGTIDLATIVSRICDRASERAGQFLYDVSDLEGIEIVGYQISRTMAARAAIETLRPVGFFDVTESAVLLNFPTRGKASIRTIADAELGAHFSGDERASKITTKKMLELELPRQIRVHYQDPARDFDPGEQLSPARFDTRAETVTDINLGVAINADKAAQCAEVAYRDAWASRWTHTMQLDISSAEIEPADCVIVPVDGSNNRMRILRVVDKIPNLRAFEMVVDDDGSYVSTAVGTVPGSIPDQLVLYGPVEISMLDLPALNASQTSPTLYAGIYPAIIDGQFRGAVIQRSTNSGGTFAPVSSAVVAVTYGTVQVPAGVGSILVFDEGGELIVDLHNGSLASASGAEVLEGANAAAVGIHGRWEILQFKDVEALPGSAYRLSGLLRGRLGTENYIGTGQVGDAFILLENVTTVPIAIAEIGASILYRATPVNTGQNSITEVSLIARSATLKPYSPVHIHGERDDSDLFITWVRRDRLADQTGVQSIVPLSESTEDYEIDVLDEDGAVRRTISVSTTAAVYTEEQQIADFGSAQSEISVVIYQISAQVGRGDGGAAIL